MFSKASKKRFFLVAYFIFSCNIVHNKPQQKYYNFMKILKIELRISETDTIDMDSRLALFQEVSHFPFSNGIWRVRWCFEWGKILWSSRLFEITFEIWIKILLKSTKRLSLPQNIMVKVPKAATFHYYQFNISFQIKIVMFILLFTIKIKPSLTLLLGFFPFSLSSVDLLCCHY